MSKLSNNKSSDVSCLKFLALTLKHSHETENRIAGLKYAN